MPIRRRITKPKEIPPPSKVPGASFVIGEFYVRRSPTTKRFHVFDGRVGKPHRAFPHVIGEGFLKLPEAVAVATAMARRIYLGEE